MKETVLGLLFVFSLLFFSRDVSSQEISPVAVGEQKTVYGPAVVMDESTFTQFLAARERETLFRTNFEQCVQRNLEANERAVRAYELARTQFDQDEKLVDALQVEVARIGAERDQLRGQSLELKKQRNVAWAVTGGLILGATTATVLTLSE